MSEKKTITEKRGRWGRRKSDFVVRYLLVTSLAAHIVVGAVMIQSCQTAYVDSVPLPPNLPYASIETEGSGNAKSYRFTLEWHRADGKLSPSAVYSEADTAAAIQEAYDTWLRYEKAINPLPHYAPADEDDPLDFNVWVKNTQWKLNNNDVTKKVVINRYWPPSLIKEINEGTKTATRQAWVDSIEERIVEFKQAVEDIKGMMAAIEESAQYEFEVDGEPLLMMLHERMAAFTAYPPDLEVYQYSNRDLWVEWDVDAWKQGQYGESTALFESFFGYAPEPKDYTKSVGFVFPD
jgi:hypothetical protein